MTTFELDTSELTPGSLALIRAALRQAKSNRGESRHFLTFSTLESSAGLAKGIPISQLKGLVEEAKRTPLYAHDFGAGTLTSSLVFESMELTGTGLEFAVSLDVFDASEPLEAQNDRSMLQLNGALAMALENAEGDPEAFAFYLSAALAGFQGQKMLNENIAMQSIRLLHQLHPSISV